MPAFVIIAYMGWPANVMRITSIFFDFIEYTTTRSSKIKYNLIKQKKIHITLFTQVIKQLNTVTQRKYYNTLN